MCLFNHKGAPTVTDMLSKLGVLARAADYVDLTVSSHLRARVAMVMLAHLYAK